ncbi:MAG: hypothetical protein FWG77_02810 [Treponema sp.]|nr:hypothetical protein [Treponema sp.]
MATRLINAKRTDIQKMSASDLKKSIWDSEGRVILSQNYVGMVPLSMGTTNPELAQAMGADMVFFNGYSANEDAEHPGLIISGLTAEGFSREQYRIPQMRKLIDVPIGVYLECGQESDKSNFLSFLVREDRIASPKNLQKLLDEKVDFVVLGGNPGTGTKYDAILNATKEAKKVLGDNMVIFSGKWEDGSKEPVIGDPMRSQDFYKELISSLIDAGADVICMPMPGSRWGINVDCIRDLVTFVHTYKQGTLVMTFLDGTVEGSDVDTIRQCSLWSKLTGADIHSIGDAGLGGMSIPENIYQMAITIKGRAKTWERMSASRR